MGKNNKTDVLKSVLTAIFILLNIPLLFQAFVLVFGIFLVFVLPIIIPVASDSSDFAVSFFKGFWILIVLAIEFSWFIKGFKEDEKEDIVKACLLSFISLIVMQFIRPY